MSDTDTPRIYLISPPEIDLSGFPNRLAQVLDAHDVACVRLALSSHDEDLLSRAADACREVTHTRDVALVLNTHFLLAERLGLDGVHLLDGARNVRKAREHLGQDAIVGAYCGTSRHDGMTAAEAGADYISFGPAGCSTLGDGSRAEPDLFAWWTEMIEVPVVAEGALDAEIVGSLTETTDFLGVGDEIWAQPDAADALTRLCAGFGAGASST